MSRATATFSVSLPPEMAEQVERVRKHEHRTRSELVREALRSYIRAANIDTLRAKAEALPQDEPMPDEVAAVRQGTAEFRRGRHRNLSRVRHELLRPARPARRKKP
jgi:Arc/MetJ-type ribon-helix-helix transcriptional regulator